MFYKSIIETIGNTPIIELNNITKSLNGNIYAKLEHNAPTLSKKDRVALSIINESEKNGLLKPGQVVVELTSGNMGTALAAICKQKGYRFIAVMSSGNSVERIKMIKAFGGEVVLVPQSPTSVKGQVTGVDLDLADQEATRITEELSAFRVDQFVNEANLRASHETALEAYNQLDGKIDVFVDFMGTCGCFTGVTEKLKELNPNIKCYGVEPASACAYKDAQHGGDGKHIIQGGGYNKNTMAFVTKERLDIIDGFISVTDEEVFNATRALAFEEGIFVGFSSGANLAAAIQVLEKMHPGANVLICTPDSGTKYLSTTLWDL